MTRVAAWLAGSVGLVAFASPVGAQVRAPASPEHIAELEAHCSGGDHAACVDLATTRRDRAARRRGLVLSDETARAILERSCLAAWAPACDELVRRLGAAPRDAGADDERGRWLALACDFGSGGACRALGDAFLTGAAVSEAVYFERTTHGPDPARAARYYAEACALGVAAACGPAIEAYRATSAPCEAAAIEARVCVGRHAPRSCAARSEDESTCAARTAMPAPAEAPPP